MFCQKNADDEIRIQVYQGIISLIQIHERQIKHLTPQFQKGYHLYATRGTADFLKNYGIGSGILHWPNEQQKPNVIDYLKDKKIHLVINIPKNLTGLELRNDYIIRRTAVDFNIPLITNARLASAFIHAFCKLDIKDLAVKSWDEYK